ncbi:virulence factor [Candidatus Marinamargulisbacteria bacterium SCGC AAA071-K20]|nr:virulence factor [Candidatus Marinamargulisbacteria bacterium SCGC AAA071-K20]
MKVLSIESTPNPRTIKLLLDVHLEKGKSFSVSTGDTIKKDTPEIISRLLEVDGINNILYFTNFIAVSKSSMKHPWASILIRAQEIINGPGQPLIKEFRVSSNPTLLYAEVQVSIQYFRDIPMQVKLTNQTSSKKIPLPEKFMTSIKKAATTSQNMLMERLWKDVDIRFGELDIVEQILLDELDAVYTEEKLFDLVNQSINMSLSNKLEDPLKSSNPPTKDADWKKRFKTLDDLGNDIDKYLDDILSFSTDQNFSVRRLAIAFLGQSTSEKALSRLIDALADPSVSIRRTAGDCLSDIGNKRAIPAMINALNDKSRLVRWRAARFLYELGDKTALAALHLVENSPEFEVSLQVKQAIHRIQTGKSEIDPMWKQLSKNG